MAMINRTGLNGRDDFIGFTFNGRHSSEFNIINVNTGNRTGKELLPSPKDITAQVTGVDGSYYFNSTYGNRQFSINFAYDDLREDDFRAMQYWLSPKEENKLIFDEEPYKEWSVKISSPLKVNFICFTEQDSKGVNFRVYKGEGTVSFISYSIIAKAPYPFLDAYNWDYINRRNGFDISAYWNGSRPNVTIANKEIDYRKERDAAYDLNGTYQYRLRLNTKDKDDDQLLDTSFLDERLGASSVLLLPRQKQWYNFDEWKGTSHLYTRKQLDPGSTSWESIVNGHKPFSAGIESVTNTASYLNRYKATHGKTFSSSGYTPYYSQIDIPVDYVGHRRYGYLSETIFLYPTAGGYDVNDNQKRRILLDAPDANRYYNKDANGRVDTASPKFPSTKYYIQNVDYRRKLTSLITSYTNGTVSSYPDVSTEYGGLGKKYNITDPWAGKIGPVRGITGKWCHIYNPGNYKTYPKIILTVLDKRSMITRSRCNYPSSTVTKAGKVNGQQQYTLTTSSSDGNYSWRYATITLYPKYATISQDDYTEKDIIGRMSLDLMKLVPPVSGRDNLSTDSTNITLSSDISPKTYTFVIDCELRLIYRISSFDTNPVLGRGPGRTVDVMGDSGVETITIPSQTEFYNTTFVPTSDIRNNAIIAGDFFEIPPYELEEYNGHKVIPGRTAIAFNSAGAACVGPYMTNIHFKDNTTQTDYSYIGQRIVWDINYL